MNEKTFSTFPVSFAFANKILHFARREKHTMNSRNALSTLRVVSIAFSMIVAFGIPTFGQEAPLQNDAAAPKPAPAMNEVLRHNIENWALQGRGVPQDWSHHHLVFSNPGTEEDAIANGTHDHWLKIVNDPRYTIQQLKRRAAQAPAAMDIATIETTAQAAASAERVAAPQDPTPAAKSKKKSKLKKDWSEPLGSGTAATLTAVVGTLSSSTISGSSTLTVDGVTFDASPPTAAAGTVQVNCTTQTCTNGTNSYTLTIGTTTYSIVSSLPGGSSPANAVLDGGSGGGGHLITTTNLRAAMLNNSAQCSSGPPCFKNVSAANATVTPGSAANPLTLTATTAGTGGNSIVLSDTGCTNGCSGEGLSQVSLDTTNTHSNVNSTTFGATGTAGSDGTTSGTSTPPTFAYWSVSTYLSSASVATNIATAVNANTTVSAVITAIANTPASGDVTFTANSAGTGGNSYSVAETNFSAFTGTGSLSGGTIATVQPNMYPAKFSFSSTIASCSGDFVVYPTGVPGAAGAANIVAYSNLYSGCGGTVPSVNYWAYNTGGMVTTSPIIAEGGAQVAFIQSNGTTATLVLLKWAPSPTPPTGVTGTFTSGSTTVNITAGTVTAADVGMQISGTGIPANDTIASVSGTTVTLATATTAAETNEALTIAPETVTTPGVPTAVTNANYRSCTAPCMTTVAFDLGNDDTFSAPFYDFESDDAIYVGDDNGYLHQFTGVFFLTPAESTTSPWPVQVNATPGTKVSSPVYDDTSGYVFVGDSTAVLHAVGTGNAGTTNGNKHGTSHSLGDTIIDGTLVDPTAGTVYAFVTTNSAGFNAVYQFSTGFTGNGTSHGNGAATGTETGTGGAGNYFYSGTFDNVYYESSSGTSPSGNLYVIGGTATASATLYQIPITNNAMAATANSAVTTLSGHQFPWPSPLTEFCNAGAGACALNAGGTATTTGTDYLFFSVYHSGKGGCTNFGGNGCILSYNISNPAAVVISGTLAGLNVTAEANPGCWATSGIEIDNSSTTTGASQIYFVNLNGNGAGGPTSGTYTSGNCGGNSVANTIQAVQASQASP